jgi:tetratricopeptide (TPR) repeat protein
MPVRLGGPALPGDLARLRADSAPAPGVGRHPDAAAHAARGDLLRLRQQLSDAADAYQASIDLDPADPEVRNDLGITLCALGRLADAERSFRRAIGLAPDYLAAHHNLCVTLRADERFADAAESARRAIAIADDDPDGYENLGDALYRLARPGEATDAYRRAAALDPGNPRLDHKLRLTRQAS